MVSSSRMSTDSGVKRDPLERGGMDFTVSPCVLFSFRKNSCVNGHFSCIFDDDWLYSQ